MVEKTYSFEKNGVTFDVYTLKNASGASMDILTYGARIIKICVPDNKGELGDVIVGYAKPEDYIGSKTYYGATIGRYGNRIGGGKFSLNGQEYILEQNDGNNTLHGGTTANFDEQNWEAEIFEDTLVLTHVSPNGAGGYPGRLYVQVFFTLTKENAVVIEYVAMSDKDTVCNLTNHAYFNIGGQDTVLDHELMIKASQITPVDGELIPHGEYMDIYGTPYSFDPPKRLGENMFSDAEMIKACNGFDFNYCLDRDTPHGLERCAYVYDRASGRKLDCFTTLPGVQLYTCGHHSCQGKKAYGDHAALCLETQRFPNAPNCPSYPSATLKAGAKWHEMTVYQFSVVK